MSLSRCPFPNYMAQNYFKNLAADATLNVKPAAGIVFSASCYNTNAASRFLQLHDTATTPSAAAVPKVSILVPTGSQVIVGTDFFSNEGVGFTNGIAFAFSTTAATYTAGSAGDQQTTVTFS
mgnify:CR=1 FL=1